MSPDNRSRIGRPALGIAKEVAVRSILLGDLFESILSEEKVKIKIILGPIVIFCSFIDHHHISATLSAVMKIDIQWYECRALTGSPSPLAHPRLFVGYIVMEWVYS